MIQEKNTEIEPERLEIIPYATLCVSCQQAQTKYKGV